MAAFRIRLTGMNILHAEARTAGSIRRDEAASKGPLPRDWSGTYGERT